MKIRTYRNSCPFDTLSQISEKIANSDSPPKSKITKTSFFKTWRGKMKNTKEIIRKIK